jgi:hypothetical protein
MRRSRFGAASQRGLPIGSPFQLWAYRLLNRLRHDIAGSSCAQTVSSSLCPPSKEELCYGLVVPFPLLSTICRHTAVKVLYPSAISQTSEERTCTALNAHHLRRTMPSLSGLCWERNRCSNREAVPLALSDIYTLTSILSLNKRRGSVLVRCRDRLLLK